MRMVDIIEKKRLKKELNKEEISFFINKYVKDEIPDYQVAAFLMATMFQGMTKKELADFTETMMHSGKVLNLSEIKAIKVDKHSTGGVGDKTTLAVAPIISAIGVPVAKMTGRGLGHTGGTIDKLESIPGFTCTLSEEQFKQQVKEHKIAIIGQSEELVPADKKLYQLRDVTNCIQSIPLIASSIMSKKLATGADTILLDVKCGKGAFMNNLKEAKELAKTMVEIGKSLNVDVRAEITNMNRPIGRQIGNKNEVLEAIETLKGNGPRDFKELVYASCTTILKQAKAAEDINEARNKIDAVINNGKALKKFYEFVQAQGGDVVKLKNSNFWNPKHKLEVYSYKKGYLDIFNSFIFGVVAMKIGAGRETKEQNIDNEAGITLHKKTNDYVNENDLIFTLYSSNKIDKSLADELRKGYKIVNKEVKNTMILDEVH